MVDIRVQGVMWQQRQASAIITDSSRGLEFGTKEKKKKQQKKLYIKAQVQYADFFFFCIIWGKCKKKKKGKCKQIYRICI